MLLEYAIFAQSSVHCASNAHQQLLVMFARQDMAELIVLHAQLTTIWIRVYAEAVRALI